MAVEHLSSGDPQHARNTGYDLGVSYLDGTTNIKTSIIWVPQSQSYKIIDQTPGRTASRRRYKLDIGHPPYLIIVRLGESFLASYDNQANQDNLQTYFTPPQSPFSDVTANYGISGAVAAGSINIVDRLDLIPVKSIEELTSSKNEFAGNRLEDNLGELFRLGHLNNNVLFPYLYIYPDGKARRVARREVANKTSGWDNASKSRAFPRLGALANQAAFEFSLRGVTKGQKRERAYVLALQSILRLPDSFPAMPVQEQENDRFYLGILHKTVQDLLQIHKNYTYYLALIHARSYYKLDYQINPDDPNGVKITFSQHTDREYGEKPKDRTIPFGGELLFSGTTYRFDNIGNGGLQITICPKGVKTAGGVFTFPAVDRANTIYGLGSPNHQLWQQAAKDLVPGFTPIPPPPPTRLPAFCF